MSVFLPLDVEPGSRLLTRVQGPVRIQRKNRTDNRTGIEQGPCPRALLPDEIETLDIVGYKVSSFARAVTLDEVTDTFQVHAR